MKLIPFKYWLVNPSEDIHPSNCGGVNTTSNESEIGAVIVDLLEMDGLENHPFEFTTDISKFTVTEMVNIVDNISEFWNMSKLGTMTVNTLRSLEDKPDVALEVFRNFLEKA